jgi:DeoR/GlpR family transcriptional regulator of sugar metabolism
MAGAQIVKGMKVYAGTTDLAADSIKYERIGFSRVLPLSAMDIIITNANLGDEAFWELGGLWWIGRWLVRNMRYVI